MANNAITTITIQHSANVPVQSVEDALAKPSTMARDFLLALIRECKAFLCGARNGKITLQMENATSLTKSSGTITLTGLPVADETVTVCGVAFTWKASAANENQVTIGADATASATALKNAINAHSKLAGLVLATSAAGVVTVTCEVPGRIGNLLTLAEASSNLTVSGALLSGAAATQQASTVTWDFGGVT